MGTNQFIRKHTTKNGEKQGFIIIRSRKGAGLMRIIYTEQFLIYGKGRENT